MDISSFQSNVTIGGVIYYCEIQIPTCGESETGGYAGRLTRVKLATGTDKQVYIGQVDMQKIDIGRAIVIVVYQLF